MLDIDIAIDIDGNTGKNTILLIPSLITDGFIKIFDLTIEEAQQFVANFDEDVMGLKVRNPPQHDSETSLELLEGNFDLWHLSDESQLVPLVNELIISKVPGSRGRRPVFLDLDYNVIGVSSTVVYNSNRATFGVNDSSIPATVLAAYNKN